MVPRLETERLILRAHRPEDFPACAAMWADPAVVRHIGGRLSTPSEAWGRMLRYAGHWEFLGFGYWAVEERATGKFVGELGFADFKRDGVDSFKGLPEVGWVLASPFHGKGFASEALARAVEWGAKHISNRKWVCLIEPANLASLKLAGKFGFREYDKTLYGGCPVILLSREGK